MNHNALTQLLMKIKSSVRPLIFLYGTTGIARTVLWCAKDYRMIEETFLWIISEGILKEVKDLFTLPSLIYGIRLKGNEDIWKFQSERLFTGLELLQLALGQTARTNDVIGTLNNCSDPVDWEYGRQLYRNLER